ncbi:MAG: DUF1573 domain-containing protein [Bacteroidales bacterium]|nr:DUF1573 domain-containing protein [Bacteroidales bacterium]
MKKQYFFSLVCMVLLAAMQATAQYLSFDKVEHDFGIISSKYPVSVNFSCTNRGSNPIVISKVETSNPNITVEITRDTLQPNFRASLMVTLNPENLSSMFTETLEVYTDDPIMKRVFLKLKGTVKDINPEIEKQFPIMLDVARLSKTSIVFDTINYPSIVTDTIRVYNPQDTAIALIFPNIPEYMTVRMLPEVIQPNSTALLILSYNSGIRKEWGNIYDRLYIGFQGRKINYKMKISVSGIISQDFSKMTRKQLKNAPKITFVQDTILFGTVKQGDPVECKFEFSNEGKSTLEILKIKTSCGCTAGTMDKMSYEKGEKGVVNVTLNTRNKRNHVRQTITIISNDPKNSEHRLFIDGQVEVNE